MKDARKYIHKSICKKGRKKRTSNVEKGGEQAEKARPIIENE